MDRTTFGRKESLGQRPRVDRFIPSRLSLDENRCRGSFLHNFDKPRPHQFWCQKHQLKKEHAKSLYTTTFGLKNPDSWHQVGQKVPPWPCVPRRQSCLSSADSVLDLPQYEFAVFPEIIDWSTHDILLAAIGKSYYKWSWSNQKLVSKGFTQNKVYTSKFDPTGELIALGTDQKSVEIHHTSISKFIVGGFCKCDTLPGEQPCSVTAIDWSPTGNSFITGCTEGALMAFSREADLIEWRQGFHSPVLMIRISPDARFVAVSAIAGPFIAVLTWPSLIAHAILEADWALTAYAWHPWRSALLGVGGVTDQNEATISLWDAAPDKLRLSVCTPGRYNIDCMQFSHRTGEMVLCLQEIDPNIRPKDRGLKLVVLSDLETVVDEWSNSGAPELKQLDRIRTMIFSPDGSKLATATLGEDLVIWNFLPPDNKTKSRYDSKRRRYSALPTYLDRSAQGFTLR